MTDAYETAIERLLNPPPDDPEDWLMAGDVFYYVGHNPEELQLCTRVTASSATVVPLKWKNIESCGTNIAAKSPVMLVRRDEPLPEYTRREVAMIDAHGGVSNKRGRTENGPDAGSERGEVRESANEPGEVQDQAGAGDGAPGADRGRAAGEAAPGV